MHSIKHLKRQNKASVKYARPGIVAIYMIVIMATLIGICSLAVDYGHVQLVKTEMQACADATARGYMTYYNVYGKTYADAHVAQIYASTHNPVDSDSGVAPTVTVTFGSWNSTTNTFSSSTGTTPAVKVVVTRTSANSNAVPLIWGAVLGARTMDVHTSAVAALMGGNTTTLNIPATANPYFAGMPNTTTNSFGDNFANNAPYQVTSIPVIPGTYLTFTNMAGTSSVVQGSVPMSGPDGAFGYVVEHGEDWNDDFDNPGSENGIATAIMPEDAAMGLFLTNNAPNLTAAPSGKVDWTSSSVANQATNSNFVVQQPFMIGNGQTSGGVTQKFLVPAGATRFYMAVWDGVEYQNNVGSLTGTVTVYNYVQLVQ